MEFKSVIAVIPAAGVGSRMKADHPKQYLSIAGDSTPTVLQACIASLSAVSQINRIVVGVSPSDGYAADLDLGKAELFRTGGATRSAPMLPTSSLRTFPASISGALQHRRPLPGSRF